MLWYWCNERALTYAENGDLYVKRQVKLTVNFAWVIGIRIELRVDGEWGDSSPAQTSNTPFTRLILSG